MDKVQQGVYDFHKKYNCLALNKPTLPDAQLALLRGRLIVEESAEFLKAASQQNMEEMVDAIGDLLYVVYGTAVVMGVDMEPISEEIQKSNMSKEGSHDSGGKVMKGSNFIPPDIKKCLETQGWNVQNAKK